MVHRTCDKTSVALIVKNGDKILLIERKKYNPGFALPAGHQDGLVAKDAALKEFEEEVGLRGEKIELRLAIPIQNPCRRDGGTHHFWQVFEVLEYNGDLKPSNEEVKKIIWADEEKIKILAEKLEKFLEAHHLAIDDVAKVVEATNKSAQWLADPGLEPPMYVLFKALKII